MEKEGKYTSSLSKRMDRINVNFVIRDLKHLFRIKCSRQRMLLVIRKSYCPRMQFRLQYEL